MGATVQINDGGTYTSFSGADAVCTFSGIVVSTVQSITVNVQREKAPIYTMGHKDPLSFSRGKRGIAGALSFAVFDRSLLQDLLEQQIGEGSGYRKAFTGAGTDALSKYWRGEAPEFESLISTQQISQEASMRAMQTSGVPFVNMTYRYADQLPPFDIVITFANEYGNACYVNIYRAELLNEGIGISIDDVVLEQAFTFVACGMNRITPGWANQSAADRDPIAGSSPIPAQNPYNMSTGRVSPTNIL